MWTLVGTLLWSGGAQAGVGPWTPGEGDRSVFVGINHGQWSRFTGGGGTEVLSLGTSVARSEVGGVLTYGLTPSVALEIEGGVVYASARRPSTANCQELGLSACDTVIGLAPVAGRAKFRVLDELTGSPLTLSVGPLVRFGLHTERTRAQLTQVGEGQTDLGGLVSLGRTGAFGPQGSFAVLVEGEATYRTPAVVIGGVTGPGAEFRGLAELVVSPRRPVGLAFDVEHLERPQGVDFETTDLADRDRFAALAVSRLAMGPKLVLRSTASATVVIGTRFTVFARNNPTDAWAVTVGVGRYFASAP